MAGPNRVADQKAGIESFAVSAVFFRKRNSQQAQLACFFQQLFHQPFFLPVNIFEAGEHFTIQEFPAGLSNHLLFFVKFFRDKYRSEEHTSELQSLIRISYAVICLKTTKCYYQ